MRWRVSDDVDRAWSRPRHPVRGAASAGTEPGTERETHVSKYSTKRGNEYVQGDILREGGRVKGENEEGEEEGEGEEKGK